MASNSMTQFDPFTRDIIQQSVAAIGDEMFVVLKKTAMSAIIYEVLDMGTGVTTAEGELAASGAGIPTFVAVFDKAVKRIIELHGWAGINEGDVFITNDPAFGGVTHLNDIAIIIPVFAGGTCVSWVGNFAHWNDIGGAERGSMSTRATEIYQEGLRLPAVKLFEGGRASEAVVAIMRANSRLPDFLEGDMWAGIAAARVGEKRIRELVDKYGRAAFLEAMDDLLDYGERQTLAGLRDLPHGHFEHQERLDDGESWDIAIDITKDSFIVDLRAVPDQKDQPYNLSRDGAVIACQMILKSATSSGTLCNGGTLRPLNVLTRAGSIFDPFEGAPHGFYFETRIRLHDALWRCLAPYLGERFPAGGFSSICGTVLGGTDPRNGRYFTMVEPQVGGWGAASDRDGVSAQYSNVHGETYTCPAEVREVRYPLTVESVALNPEAGGHGKYRGGRGICAVYRVHSSDAFLTVGYSRSVEPPWGMDHGDEGTLNYVEVERVDGSVERYSFASAVPVADNEIVRIVTGCGAGWGSPRARSAEAIAGDMKNGQLSRDEARDIYGANTS
ncbi:MAG: hydantoinase B/oxoprolinase family protein [Hyphomicrobiaceae bacterium]